jgi:hypothetical protein
MLGHAIRNENTLCASAFTVEIKTTTPVTNSSRIYNADMNTKAPEQLTEHSTTKYLVQKKGYGLDECTIVVSFPVWT